jgi:glycosyltransferase involved in cell wall biosynthesis
MQETNKNYNPLISIITPSLNQGRFIKNTILSVLGQSYKNIQYIIIDGGSSDQTLSILDEYRDKIDIIISEKDKGQTDALNKGFKLAKGELVGWINSDDILYANCLESIVMLFNKKSDGAIYYSVYNDIIDGNGNKKLTLKNYIPSRSFLLNDNYDINQQASFYNNHLLGKIGYLNDELDFCMDLDLWLRLLNHGNIYSYTEASLGAFRLWEETKTTTSTFKFIKEIRKVLLSHGASYWSPNIRRTFWYQMKSIGKSLIEHN